MQKARLILLNGYTYAGPITREDEHAYTIHDEKTGRDFTINKQVIERVEWGEEQ